MLRVVQEGLGYREWLVPAQLLNTKASKRMLSSDETCELEWA